MQKILIIPMLFCFVGTNAQLYIAPGDSISVLPGTLFTLQENLVNNGKIYNNGVLTCNGSLLQNISGTGGTIDNVTADNNIMLMNDITVNNTLLINTGKVVDLSNRQLTNNGNINGAGLLKGSRNASLILNGSGNSSIQFDQTIDTVSNDIKNIILSGSGANIIFQNKLNLYGSLIPTAGNITLNDEFVLRSTIIATARVAAVGSTINYGTNGKFVVERFVPGNRAWRLLTAPITKATQLKISDAWQDNAPRVTNVNIIDGINNPNPGYGTHVTFGLPAINGYDQGINGNPSLRYLVNSGWNGVPTATNDGSTLNSGYINDQPGYMLFVRGDRSTLLWQAVGAATTPTILRPKGKINTGNYDHPLGAGFNNGFGSVYRVIGNPYPCPVNFHSIVTNSINAGNGFADAFYVWDPNITGNNAVGGFVGMSYNAAASIAAGNPVYDRSVGFSSISNNGDIQSSAAIVIDYTGSATSLRFDETQKSAGSNNTFFRPALQIRTSLLAENNDHSVSVNDAVLSTFSEKYANEPNQYDLKKLENFGENISVLAGSQKLCIDRRKPILLTDTIFYNISKLKVKNYQLLIEPEANSMPAGAAAFLEDIYLQQKTPFNLNDTFTYRFTVSGNNGSAGNNRFRLIFKPVNTFTAINAILVNENVQINWAVEDEFFITKFEIEKSTDGKNFFSAGTLAADSYTWLDVKPVAGSYFYRIKCLNSKGGFSYSAVVKMVIPNNSNDCYVYPNPATGNTIWLYLKQSMIGVYSIRLTDKAGKVVQIGKFNSSGGSIRQKIQLNNKNNAAIYQLEILEPDKGKKTIQVVMMPF